MTNFSFNKIDLSSLFPLERALKIIEFYGKSKFDADTLALEADISLPIAKKALKLVKQYCFLETEAQPIIRCLAYKSNRTAFTTEEVYEAVSVAFKVPPSHSSSEIIFKNYVRWAIKKMKVNRELRACGKKFYINYKLR